MSDKPKSNEINFGIFFMVLYMAIFGLLAAALWGFALYQGTRNLFSNESAAHATAISSKIAIDVESPTAREARLLLAAGEKYYTSCVLCHGEHGEGNAGLAAPALNRLDTDYIQRQLVNFKEGRRGTHAEDPEGARMRAMAMTLPDEASVKAVSAYVESMEAPLPPLTIEGDPDAGKASYALCASCHGQNAEGNPNLKAPALVGLQDWYLLRSLWKFKAGARGYAPEDTEGTQMRSMAMTITDGAAMKNIVAHIASLSAETTE